MWSEKPVSAPCAEKSMRDSAMLERMSRSVSSHTAGLQLLTVMRSIATLKSRLQRTNPVQAQQKYNAMFSELIVLEARRKQLQSRSLGALD